MVLGKGKSGALSALAAKLGAKGAQAISSHANDEMEIRNYADLPPGITGGVAQVTECKFGIVESGKTNQGQPYLYMAATVLSPETFVDASGNKHRTKDGRTSITELICDTPDRKDRKTVDDHIAFVMNEFRKLGVDTTQFKDTSDLENAATLVREHRPLIYFSTTGGRKSEKYPTPAVFHTWLGLAEAQEDTAAAPDQQVSISEEAPPVDQAPQESAPDYSQVADASELLTLAMNGDEAAGNRIVEIALAAGVAEEVIQNSESYEQVVQAITDTGTSAPELRVGAVGTYHPTDPKTKKKATKPVQCEVISISPDRSSLSLKNLATKVQYFKVPTGEFTLG